MKKLNATEPVPDTTIHLLISNGIRYAYEKGDNLPVLQDAAGVIEQYRNSARSEIDAHADQARKEWQYIHHIDKEMILISKNREAERYKKAGYPVDLTPYPFISAQTALSDLTSTIICDTILGQHENWINMIAKNEALRVDGHRKIKTLKTNKTVTDQVVKTRQELEKI